MNKKLLSLFLAFAMMFSFSGCGGDEASDEDAAVNVSKTISESADSEDESWAIYWYLCGSDLETNYGCATADLDEMFEVQLPENVNVIIQTGGSAVWQNDLMNPEMTQRWLYNSEGLQLIEEQEAVNMGEAQTLYEFLDFASTNYPADKTAVTFWNQGGGSVNGAAFDELYGFDSLDLTQFGRLIPKVLLWSLWDLIPVLWLLLMWRLYSRILQNTW